MNAESAAFVPSRGRLSLNDSTHIGVDAPISQDEAGSHSNSTPASRIPRSTSAHNSPLVDTASGKFAGHPSNTSSSHNRSSSLPGNGASSHAGRGRGGSSTRGRGSSSRGRGSARGGHSNTSDRLSTQQTKKPSDAPSRPPVALDSVDEFPALGGGAPAPVPSKSASTESASGGADDASSSNLSKSSPTLSPSQSMKGLSFARVVAPAPPPSAPSSAPTPQSSNTTATPASSSQTSASAPAQSEKKNRTASASSTSASSQSPSTSNPSSVSEHTRATSPSTSMSPVLEEQADSTANRGTSQQPTTGKKKKKRSSKDQQGQGQGPNNAGPNVNSGGIVPENAFNMYNGVYAEGGAYERDPFNVVIPDDAAQVPYFDGSIDPNQQASTQSQQQPPQPGLTPVQIAFLAANGFNVEGMPNVPNDAGAGMSIEALQEYYNSTQAGFPQNGEIAAAGTTASSSNLGKSTSGGKKESKKSKKERNQAGHPNHGYPSNHHQMHGQNGPYGTFDSNQPQYPYYDPQYYDEQQHQQYAQYQQQAPYDSSAYQQQGEPNEQQSSQPPLKRANGSFHFHPDVPSFQPKHFSPNAQEFKPKSPLLHADAPVFVPPSLGNEEQSPQTTSDGVKAPNGFPSATGEAQEETPKPSLSALPEEAESRAQQEENKGAKEEGPAPSSVIEKIQEQASEAVETVKEAVSSNTATEATGATEEEKGDHALNISEDPKTEQESENAEVTDSDSATKGEQPEQAEVQSPPHSTFSLLPPVTVEDVLDKAQSMADSVKDTAQDAAAAVGETVQSVKDSVAETLAPSDAAAEEAKESEEQVTKDNLDELDIPNDEDEEVAPSSEMADTSASKEASANLDELDIPDEQAIEQLEQSRHSKESSSTSASGSVAPGQSQHSISPSEVEHQLATATEAETGMPALQDEIAAIAQTSFAARSVPQFEIVSSSEDQCFTGSEATMQEQTKPEQATLEIISISEDVCDIAVESSKEAKDAPSSPLQIISHSEDRCTTEDETRGARSATLDSLASTESSAVPFVRSSAPSPASRQEELSAIPNLARPDVPALSIPLQTPPVVISPSTPISPESGSPIRPAQLSSPKPLSKTWPSKRPEPMRQPSEAEKNAAIRLVQELRSEPSTPIMESEDMLGRTSSDTVNASTPGESSESDTFRFDLSGRFSELNSSKRKRGKADDEEEEDPDKKERKVDDSGEAPSLTMSIFSGSILPRKQFIVSIFASLGINLFLPFVNGVMLGFGEIFARDWLGPLFGFGRNRSNSNSSNQSFSQSGLGLRGAGNRRGGAQDVPGHAAAKTAVETVTEEIAQAPSKL